MFTQKLKILAAIGAAAMTFGFATASSAATCDAAYATNVDDGFGANDGCELGTTNNDFLNPLQVNADQMHGFDDWMYAGKLNFGDGFEPGDVDIGFAITGDVTSGTWDVIDTLFDTYTDLMIVAKGGNGNVDPDVYVGYLFTGAGTGATDGSYFTPFLAGNNANPGDISHFTAYVRGTPDECDPNDPDCFPGAEVPVPAGLPLMLTAIGVGAYMRKRARKTA